MEALTKSGRDIQYMEDTIGELVTVTTVHHTRFSAGPFLQRWMSELDSVGHFERLLQLLANLVRHNSAYLDQPVLAGLVQ